MHKQKFTYHDALLRLEELLEENQPFSWDREKQKLQQSREDGSAVWTFRLPLTFPVPDPEERIQDYVERIPEEPLPYFLILIQAGHSSIGYFEEGEVVHHKTIKKYMVRGKGKAQIGYLNTRGKSKAGSRVRLANTVAFFEDINAKLREWDVEGEVNRILLSCPIRLRSLLFESKVTPPFDKKDPRLMKVPMDIHRPDHEEMLRISQALNAGYWEIPE